MKNLFSYDSPVITALNTVADMALVSISFLLACIPVVTIGAAQSALFTVAFRWTERDDAGLKKFWSAYCTSLRGSLLPCSIMLLAGFALGCNLYITLQNNVPLRIPFLILCVLLAVVYLAVLAQLFPFFSKFSCTSKQLFANALLTALAHPLRTLVIASLDVFPWLLLVCSPGAFFALTPLWAIAYAAIRGYITALLMRGPYGRYQQQFENSTDP